MKKKKIILKIDNPCSEIWDSFSQKDYVGYCSHCCKNVIDFTKLSDNELCLIFSMQATKICGRFNIGQLNRVISSDKLDHNSTSFNKILAGLLLVGVTQVGLANEAKATQGASITKVAEKSSIDSDKQFNSKKTTKDSIQNFVEGTVVDEHLNPIAFASVLIKGTKNGVFSNNDGHYKIIIPDSFANNKITIEVSAVGYEVKEFHFTRKSLPLKKKLTIKMVEVIMGEVVIINSDN